MRGFKDGAKDYGRSRERKNRCSLWDISDREPSEFMREDYEFNVDAELESDFTKAV